MLKTNKHSTIDSFVRAVKKHEPEQVFKLVTMRGPVPMKLSASFLVGDRLHQFSDDVPPDQTYAFSDFMQASEDLLSLKTIQLVDGLIRPAKASGTQHLYTIFAPNTAIAWQAGEQAKRIIDRTFSQWEKKVQENDLSNAVLKVSELYRHDEVSFRVVDVQVRSNLAMNHFAYLWDNSYHTPKLDYDQLLAVVSPVPRRIDASAIALSYGGCTVNDISTYLMQIEHLRWDRNNYRPRSLSSAL